MDTSRDQEATLPASSDTEDEWVHIALQMAQLNANFDELFAEDRERQEDEVEQPGAETEPDWPPGLIEALDTAIDRCVDDLRDCHPGVPREPAAALIAEAQRYMTEMVELRRRAGAVSAADTRADELIAAIAKERAILLKEHKQRWLAPALREFLQLRETATREDLDITNALDQADAKIRQFDAYTYIGVTTGIDHAMETLRTALHYARQAELTRKQRLPVDPRKLDAHEKLCGRERVQQLLATVKPGKIDEPGAGPMGKADPHYDAGGYPQVVVVGTVGHYHLQPTRATDAATHICTVMPIGEFSLGQIVEVEPGKAVRVMPADGSANFRYKLADAEQSWLGKELLQGIDAECFREIECREMEHLVDFDHAFQIGPAALARVVNSLADLEHAEPSSPIKTLLKTLIAQGMQTLIPREPLLPAAWPDRMTEVMTEVSGYSTDRDTRGTHSPAGTTCTVSGSSVLLRPAFREDSLQTPDIITLARKAPVYTGNPDRLEEEAEAAQRQREQEQQSVDDKPQPNPSRQRASVRVLKKGDTARCFATLRFDGHIAVGNAEDWDAGLAPMDTEFLIELDPDESGQVWVSAPCSVVRISETPDGRAYFQLSINDLE